MHSQDQLEAFLEHYTPADALEIAERESFIKFMNVFGDDAYRRENLIGHICASCWVINHAKNKVLMVHHNLYGSWGWIGGHAGGKKNLMAVAIRETAEETGVTNLRLLTTSPVDINVLGVKAHIKHGKEVPAHLHFNVVYAFIGDEHQALKSKPDENSAVAWIDADKVGQICSEPHMLPIYERIMQKVKKMG